MDLVGVGRMKLIYEKLTLGSEEGFTFKEILTRDFSCPWHFHTECELILTLEFTGFRMVGDDIAALEPGDLVLMGSNLPHMWQSDTNGGRSGTKTRILLAQFNENFLGEGFWSIPATHPLRQLLKRAAVGLCFRGEGRERATALMLEMDRTDGLRRIALFLETLEILASCPECSPVASAGYVTSPSPYAQERMDRVFRYVSARLERPIPVGEAAVQAGLSEGAFSRFFHLHSGRTFPEFVNEMRVARACRLLAESDLKITEVALRCGFQNLSNLNRQFLRWKRSTPRAFRGRLQGR